MHNFYIKTNDGSPGMAKYGYVKGNETNLSNRIHDSCEEHPELSTFIYIFKFEKNEKYIYYKEIDKIVSLIGSDIKKIEIVEDIYNISLPLLRILNKYLIKSETKQSNEFVSNEGIPILLEVLKEEFPLLGLDLIKEYTSEEIKKINNTSKEQYKTKVKEDYHELIKWHEEMRKKKQIHSNIQKKDEYKWYEREYQRLIIEYGYEQLLRIHKLFLELATGGGKSYIVYKLFEKLEPDIIVIFSPRKNINIQNCSSKYLSILKDDYLVYNCSEDKDFDSFKYNCRIKCKKMLIVACPLSNEKVYNMVSDYKNICVWFDEAHNTIENWVNKIDNKYTKFFLEDVNITNRVFTSASPDKTIIEQYPQYFGEIYSPIKVKELIDLKWLCPILPHIFSLNRDNIDICNYNLEHFEKYKCKFGFSFHNLRDSAYDLFLKHYIEYKSKKTIIKPYLLVGNDYKIPDKIELDYDYRNIRNYEETTNSMGYVVQRYSMGYDFDGIDYIIFSDPKMSYSDIIQCIGRGIRPDGLGEYGKNINKNLSILLPIYIDIDLDTDFNRIEHVLRYLVHDIEYPFEKMYCDFNESNGDKKLLGQKYDGLENMKAILLDLLRGGKYSTWKETDFIRLLKNHNIHSRYSYNEFIKYRQELNLPQDPYRCFPDFTWEHTYNISPYYSKEECKTKICELKDIHDLEDEEEPELYLHSLDPKIPPICLFRFYGGHNNNEYY